MNKLTRGNIIEILFVISFLTGFVGLMAGLEFSCVLFFVGLIGMMFSGENYNN